VLRTHSQQLLLACVPTLLSWLRLLECLLRILFKRRLLVRLPRSLSQLRRPEHLFRTLSKRILPLCLPVILSQPLLPGFLSRTLISQIMRQCLVLASLATAARCLIHQQRSPSRQTRPIRLVVELNYPACPHETLWRSDRTACLLVCTAHSPRQRLVLTSMAPARRPVTYRQREAYL
jgi:hypothetical protein